MWLKYKNRNILAHYQSPTQSLTVQSIIRSYNQNVVQSDATQVCRFPFNLVRVQKQMWSSPFQASGIKLSCRTISSLVLSLSQSSNIIFNFPHYMTHLFPPTVIYCFPQQHEMPSITQTFSPLEKTWGLPPEEVQIASSNTSPTSISLQHTPVIQGRITWHIASGLSNTKQLVCYISHQPQLCQTGWRHNSTYQALRNSDMKI